MLCTPMWKPTSEQSEKLFAELGRCVFTYQAIELRLKFLLPHMIIPGTENHAKGEGIGDWRVYLDSKETMGMLMQRLKDRSVLHDVLARDWTQLVEQRNEVVHHFLEQPFAKLESEAAFNEAIRFLQDRRTFASTLLNTLQAICVAFSYSLEMTSFPDML
ncbi:MAG TPA: hypothetical protein VGE55_11155 [Limnobacter sp.]|uniref:hypothetical protein n=1 Tax=Limnobacter sp. TaxID=2003368 RepID=UPI002ED890BB